MFEIIGSVLFSILSAGGIIAALSSWLGKVWANIILEKDKLKYKSEFEEIKANYIQEVEKFKIQTEKSIFVHKLQYEKEFEIYIEIWEALFDVNIYAQQLRPVLDRLPEDKEKIKEEKMKRNEKFSDAYNKFSKLIKKYAPFYLKEIYEKLIKLRNEIHLEGKEYQFTDIENLISINYGNVVRRFEKIEVIINEIVVLIRERIEQMKVLNWS